MKEVIKNEYYFIILKSDGKLLKVPDGRWRDDVKRFNTIEEADNYIELYQIEGSPMLEYPSVIIDPSYKKVIENLTKLCYRDLL